MSPDEFWEKVGDALKGRRIALDRSLPGHKEDPSRNTAEDIEGGEPATIKKLEAYAEWLEISLIDDVFRPILMADAEGVTYEGLMLARFHDRLHPDDQALLRTMAEPLARPREHEG